MSAAFLLVERWKPIPGYEGIYEVSNLGRVRSLDRIVWRKIGRGETPERKAPAPMKGKLLRPGKASNGYPTVSLRGKTHTVHSLVLLAFVGPAPEGHECRHLDGNRENPRLSNLRWGTRAENVADAAAHGTQVRGERYSTAKLTDEAARKIRELRGKVTQSELAEMFGVSPAAIQAVHDGRTWKHV